MPENHITLLYSSRKKKESLYNRRKQSDIDSSVPNVMVYFDANLINSYSSPPTSLLPQVSLLLLSIT